MLYNNLKIALRQFLKQKGTFTINILGLSIGLTACILLFLWVNDEQSIDAFHEKGDRIYQVQMVFPDEQGVKDISWPVSYPLGKAIGEQLAGVEASVIVHFSHDRLFEVGGETFKAAGSAGSFSVFEVFSFPVLAKDPQLSQQTNTIYLSRSLAERLAGLQWQGKLLGELLLVNSKEYVVAGIFADIPTNSSLQFDYLLNIEQMREDQPWIEAWGNSSFAVYALLQPGQNPTAQEEQITALLSKQEDYEEGVGVILQPYEERYLYSKFEDGEVAGGRIEYVRLFTIGGIILLLLACINFVNLATARATRRAREVGVRKTVGANRTALIGQFLTEAFLLTLIAVGLAILFAELMLPEARLLTEKPLALPYQSPGFWVSLSGLILITTLAAGIYPAFVLSSFRAVQVLRGKFTTRFKDVSLRKGLVVTQFVLSLFLIIGALVVQQQVDYLKNKNLGLDRSNLIQLSLEGPVLEKYPLLKEELLQKPGVASVTTLSHQPISVGSSTSGVEWPGKTPQQRNQDFTIFWTNDDFLETFHLSMAAGRYYREQTRADSAGLVINETAAEVMGLTEPVGQTITFWEEKRQIIGVIQDFHTSSLYDPMAPLIVLYEPENTWLMYLRSEPGRTQDAINGLLATFEAVAPAYQVDYTFTDEAYERMYKSETLTGSLANYFALIAIFISCLGLLGLAAFAAEQKTKEIGIRKVLGATVTNIVGLLSKEFLWLVSLGIVLGVPGAYYLAHRWLDKFAYNIEITWWMLLLPVVVALSISMLVVVAQALRAALVNPVDAIQRQ